jgi:hypothetical protein
MNICEMKKHYTHLINNMEWITNKITELRMANNPQNDRSIANYSMMLRRYSHFLEENYLPNPEESIR